MNSKQVARVKRWAIGMGVVAYIGAATLGTAYGSAALYQLFHKQRPHGLTWTTTRDNWRSTASDPRERKKVALSLGVPAAALFFMLPMLALSIGPKRRELHGSARFANRMEIAKAGLKGDKGIILGKHENRFLMLGGSQSVLLSAPTRSGKGVGIVVPNLLAWPDSTVVLDVKPELFRLTAGFRAAHGQKVYAWAPFAEDGRTHCYNPLAYIRIEHRYVIGDILGIAQIIYPSDVKDTGNTVFFNDQARNLFLGLALYLVETPELPRTIGELLRQASGRGKPIKDHLQALITEREKGNRPLSDRCVDALMRFLTTSDNTLTSILATLNAPLTVFVDALVDAATSKNDFSLQDLRRQRMSVYVCIPVNRLADASVLLNLFFAQFISLNTAELPEHNPALKYQCLTALDEMTTMGRVPILAKSIGYLAGFGLRFLSVVQSRAQIDSVMGDKDARTFITNHAVEILFAPREQRDANEYSETLGTFTEKSESKGRSTSHGKSGSSSQSSNISPQRRPLLLPQEFKEIGIDKEVLLVENVKPILADKICYYTDPAFMSRLTAPPELPQIDLELYRARIEQRVRVAADGEMFSIERIAADFDSLPVLSHDAGDAELASFVSAFFRQLAIAESAAEQAPTEELTS
jgi:type IV secretion system protein VirD4